jgi:hypothetical protein
MMKSVVAVLFLLVVAFGVPSWCLAAGVNGDSQIAGMFDGSPIVIKTTNRLAGAIDSLVWKGKEFVDSTDHGRQIQTAWTVNGHGQCYNPTEAGSHLDGPTSSSILLDIRKTSEVSYYTKSKPAFWDPPEFQDPGCNFDVNGTNGPWLGGKAINKTVVSDWILEKWVTIGYAGIPNIIKYISRITVPINPDVEIDYIILDQPSVHMPGEFNKWEQYNPQSKLLIPPNTFYGLSNRPHVLSTPDGNFALSVYSPEIPEQGMENLPQYPYLGYQVILLPLQNLSVNGERIAKTESFTPGSTHTYVSYIIIGNTEQVRQSLQLLYALNLPATMSGDLNNDKTINIHDYNILVVSFGTTGTPGWIVADINPDGKIDIFDYNILVYNFKATQ